MIDNINIARVGNAREHVARKSHRCTICGKPIIPGQTYGREVWRDYDALDARHSIGVAKYHITPRCDTEACDGR